MPAERLWTDKQIIGFNETVDTMRKIRTAATDVKTPGVINRARSLLRRSEQLPAKSGEVILFDAEKLGESTGKFVAARLTKTTNGEREFEEWQDALSDTKKEYRKYKSSTFAKTGMLEVVGMSIIGRLRNLSIDPTHMINWDLIKNNNLGAEGINALIEKNIGIISPLSGDYIMACTYSSFIERTRDKSFAAKPAALSKDLKLVILPKNQEGNPIFEMVPEIGIYIDTTETGSTGKILYSAVKNEYTRQTVHQPPTTRTEFEQSKKIKDFWDQARN